MASALCGAKSSPLEGSRDRVASGSPPDNREAVHVDSEVGRLRVVLVHRPDLELRRLRDSSGRLLTDDIQWERRVRQEHDFFAEALRDEDVDVLVLTDLLIEILSGEGSRRWLLERAVTAGEVGPSLVEPVRNWLSSLDADLLARHLVGGATRSELSFAPAGLAGQLIGDDDLVLSPLPNQIFTRDTSSWIYNGVALSSMALPGRRRETLHLEAIYRFHPRFRGADFATWFGGVDDDWGPSTIEGGDVLVLGGGAVVIGVGGRTTPQALEGLAGRLFGSGAINRLVTVDLPRTRAPLHLDELVTMVAPGTFLAASGVADSVTACTVTPGDHLGHVNVTARAPLFEALDDVIGRERVHVIVAGGDECESDRGTRDATNVLAIGPGIIVAYEGNVGTNAALRAAGIELVTVADRELGFGCGGPRSLSCPILRDAL